MPDTVLGRGRAAVVHSSVGRGGEQVARKIFIGSTMAGLVNLFFIGSKNPYVWDRTAIEEAACRRRILAHLVPWWLPGKARVAAAIETGWNSDHQTNEMSTELIEGRGMGLHHAFSADREWEYQDLRKNVMLPLQKHLIAGGFDGLAWQAGYGNPVAAGNFLLETNSRGEKTWVWIDMEFGVPAFIPLSPIAFFRFYLPRALKYGRLMFDDVDQRALERYIAENNEALTAALGEQARNDLCSDVEQLGKSKAAWRGMSRIQRSLAASVAGRVITEDQAAWYQQHPLKWYGRELSRGLSKVAKSGWARVAGWFAPKRLQMHLAAVVRFITSAKFRSQVAHDHVRAQVEAWRSRKQLSQAEADEVLRDLQSDEASLYVTDFGIHLAIKPLVKAITWLVLPALYGAGVIQEVVLVTGIVAGGSIGRSIYTIARIGAALGRKTLPPWIALAVGVFPVIGNLAFPLQLLYVGNLKDKPIAKFLIYSYLSLIGGAAPIWGCQDSLLEHWSNHLGDIIVRDRRGLKDRPVRLSA